MSGFIPPWPPADPTQPLPFDQRGCCWPWGLAGPSNKLPMRYDVIGLDGTDPIHFLWQRLATGQVMMADQFSIRIQYYLATGGQPPDHIILDHFDSTWVEGDPPHWYTTCIVMISNVLGWVAGFGGHLPANAWNTPFYLPATSVTGPSPQPDRIYVQPVQWWQSSTYPWYGA